MHDIRAIRDDPAAYDAAWAMKGFSPQSPAILALDESLRAAQTALQAAQARRNEASKLIGQAKAAKDEARASALMAEVDSLKAAIAENTEAESRLGGELRDILSALPNRPAAEVPPGEDETGNVEVRRHGEPFAIENPADHVDLGAALGMMDFETAARYRIPILSILFNNFSMACELDIMPVSTERFRATDISGNYADFAKALGGYGERITDPAEIIPAIRRGIQKTQEGTPVLLEFITGLEVAQSRWTVRK